MHKISINGKCDPQIENSIIDALSVLEGRFKVELKHPISVILCLTREDYEKEIGRKTEDWEVGNTNSNTVHVLHPESFEKYSTHKRSEFVSIIKHELAHVFIGQLSDKKTIPMWLDEGLANYLADQTEIYASGQSIYAETNFLNKLSTNYGWDLYSSYNGYAYSCLFVHYLVKKYGFDKIFELISKSSKMFSIATFESLFQEIFMSKLIEDEQLFVNEFNQAKP